ncbi:hypothetical protein [Myxococcus xanthus]|nr:hypothetical protein [Myxococcus xanthus]
MSTHRFISGGGQRRAGTMTAGGGALDSCGALAVAGPPGEARR